MKKEPLSLSELLTLLEQWHEKLALIIATLHCLKEPHLQAHAIQHPSFQKLEFESMLDLLETYQEKWIKQDPA